MKTWNNQNLQINFRLFFVFLTFTYVAAQNNNDQTRLNSVDFDDKNIKFLKNYAYFKSFNQVPRFVLDSAHEKWSQNWQNSNLRINFHSNSSVKEKQLKDFGARDAIMIIIAAIALFIAAGGGIGGGGVLVPLYILVGQFSTISAVALSNVTVMGGALANLSCNIMRRNQFVDRPLIDWDLIMIMEGPTILGAILGGHLNKLIPSWMTGLFLLLLLIQMAYVLIKKGIKMYSTESRTKLMEQNQQKYFRSLQADDSDTEITKSLLQDEVTDSQDDISQSNTQLKGNSEQPKMKVYITEYKKNYNQVQVEKNPSKNQEEKLQKMLEREKRSAPWERILLLILMFGSVAASDLLKPIVCNCGSLIFWLLTVSCIPIVILITGVMRLVILDKFKFKELGGALTDQEVHWNPVNTIKFPMICSLAGVVAGMFGVGGGIVKAPLMLAMGVPPDVAAATSATMILFTAGSASTIYISFGAVPVTYGIVLFTLGFIVTIGGQLLVYRIVNISGRRSIIALSMGVFMLCAAVMMGIHVVVIMINLIKNHLSWLTINQICG